MEFARLKPDVRREVTVWLGRLEAVARRMAAGEGGKRAMETVAAREATTYSSLKNKWYRHGEEGWRALVNQARQGAGGGAGQEERLPGAFLSEVARRFENNQRVSKPEHRRLIDQWRRWRRTGDPQHAIEGYDAAPAPGPNGRHPAGWSYRTLLRVTKLSRLELVAARVGRDAAAAHRPLVFTTRRGSWVGARYQFDDIWHDHFCNCFDQRQAGRPLEFHCLDQFSACKIAWGMRLRTRTEEGREKGLTAADMRFLLAYVLGEIGYSPRGTILVVEKGTAAIDRHLAKFLFDATDGLIADVLHAAPRRADRRIHVFSTNVVRSLAACFDSLRRTGGFGIYAGASGIGKTCAVEDYLGKNASAVGLSATQWNAGSGGIERMFFELLDTRGWSRGTPRGEWITRHFRGSNRLIVIDQAQRLTRMGRRWLIDFHLQSGCPIALIGDDLLLENLGVDKELRGAASTRREFTLKDVAEATQAMLGQLWPDADAGVQALAEQVTTGIGHLRALKQQISMARDILTDPKFKGSPALSFESAHALAVINKPLLASGKGGS